MNAMLKCIFRQLWFYRRNNAWLFVGLTVVITVSWFLVNELWTSSYRIRAVSDGMDTEGVYCVILEALISDAQRGYDPERASYDRMEEDFRSFGNTLRNMPEVEAAEPVSSSHPGVVDGMSMTNIFLDSTDFITVAMFERECGAGEMDLLDYDVVWPSDGKIRAEPGSVIVTKDLADRLFPGQNPVGRAFNDLVPGADKSEPVAGVIGSIRFSGYSDHVPTVIINVSDMVESMELDVAAYVFRLRSGVDAGAFLENADSRWPGDMQYGNWRVRGVFSMEDNIERGVASNILDRQFVWRALWYFLVFSVLMAVASTGWMRAEERRGEIGVRRAMGGSPLRIVLDYVAEVWIVFILAAAVGVLLTVNIIMIGKIDTVRPENTMGMLPFDSALYPLLYNPGLHFLAVECIVLGMLLLAVTVAAVIPLAGAVRQSPVEALRDE